MPEEKVTSKSPKISVKIATKRQFDIIAASEGRHVYEVVDDALKLYKAVAIGKTKKKKIRDIPVQDVVSAM